MVKITNGSRVTVVTKGAFEEMYKPLGWKICDLSNENLQTEDLPEEDEILEEEEAEVANLMAPDNSYTPEEEEVKEDFEIPVSEMKLSELREYAESHGIDISAAKNKQDIKAIIKAEMEA